MSSLPRKSPAVERLLPPLRSQTSRRRRPSSILFHHHPSTLILASPSHHQSRPFPSPAATTIALSLLAAASLLLLLPRDLPRRWRLLLSRSHDAEASCRSYPSHLFQAVVASEDRAFFRHIGIDPLAISRAIIHFPSGGGGSTITQQVAKNAFLNGERKISRKIVEMALAIALETRMSKWSILSSYLSIAYWGNGKRGIHSSSLFYFGKHPSLLTLGESALLAGILPSPELLSPFRDPRRGKFSQAKVLRRMVAAGFLDIQTALSTVIQPLDLNYRGGEKEIQSANKENTHFSSDESSSIWDWEMASTTWEARESLQLWAEKKPTIRRASFPRP